jgi:hypothetical protein
MGLHVLARLCAATFARRLTWVKEIIGDTRAHAEFQN